MSDDVEHQLIIRTYSTSSNDKFEYTLSNNKKAPKFVIAQEITNSSGIADVIRVLGEPSYVTFMEQHTVAKIPAVLLWYGAFENGEMIGTLTFVFSGENEKLLEVSYTYYE